MMHKTFTQLQKDVQEILLFYAYGLMTYVYIYPIYYFYFNIIYI